MAPHPPNHPLCGCVCTPFLFTSAANARENPQAIAADLRSLDPQDAARVAGSKVKREAALKGENLLGLVNAVRPAEDFDIGHLVSIRAQPIGRAMPVLLNALIRPPHGGQVGALLALLFDSLAVRDGVVARAEGLHKLTQVAAGADELTEDLPFVDAGMASRVAGLTACNRSITIIPC